MASLVPPDSANDKYDGTLNCRTGPTFEAEESSILIPERHIQ